jgi:SAM-dependent methyltransferase
MEMDFLPSPEDLGLLSYRCNVCGEACKIKAAKLDREASSCPNCSSSVRMRSIIHILSMELFGRSLSLPEFPSRPDISGLGLSDWEGYALPLSKKLNYKNTFFDREPRLDITHIDSHQEGTLDFLIASEVFEHIPPPVSLAFENAFKLLKPKGLLILTVPFKPSGDAVEHFPDLNNYQIVRSGDGYLLKNITQSGQEQIFKDLIFHGGPGFTLEMRLFSQPALLKELAQAGFKLVKIHGEAFFEFGIYWSIPWAVPLSARKSTHVAQLQIMQLPQETNNISFRIERFFQNKGFFELEGWAYIKGMGCENVEIFIVFKSIKKRYLFDANPIKPDSKGIRSFASWKETYLFDVLPVKRPDVTEYFKTFNFDDSGFLAVIPLNGIEKETYQIGLYIRNNEAEALQFITTWDMTDEVLMGSDL